ARADRLRTLERKPAAENGQPAEEDGLVFSKQAITPIDRSVHRLQPLRVRPASSGKQAEALAELAQDVPLGHHVDAGCCQFDGERQTVEVLADFGDRLAIGSVDLEVGKGQSSSRPE